MAVNKEKVTKNIMKLTGISRARAERAAGKFVAKSGRRGKSRTTTRRRKRR